MLVNPVSGSSKGKKIYFHTVAEVFKEANIVTDVISKLTQSQLSFCFFYVLSKIDESLLNRFLAKTLILYG